MIEAPPALDGAEVLRGLEVDAEVGLDLVEALRRALAVGRNAPEPAPTRLPDHDLVAEAVGARKTSRVGPRAPHHGGSR